MTHPVVVAVGSPGNGNLRTTGTSSRDDNETGVKKNRNLVNLSNTEEKARSLFLEGVEHERNGEFFEAIQKYRKAVKFVPDIEFKVEAERRGNDNNRNREKKETGKN